MKRHKRIMLLFTVLATLWGCTPSFVYLSDPIVYVKKDIPQQETLPNIAVLPFECPSYYPEIGMYTAKLFFQRLHEKKEFESVSFLQVSDWYEKGMSWHGKTALAVELGRELNIDYILFGSIDQYLTGYITSNKITVTARLIEVATEETLYFATEYGSGKPGKTFLMFDIKAGEPTPSASSVLYAVVDRIMKDCFKHSGHFKFLSKISSSFNN
jgi:TolB-like protein